MVFPDEIHLYNVLLACCLCGNENDGTVSEWFLFFSGLTDPALMNFDNRMGELQQTLPPF